MSVLEYVNIEEGKVEVEVFSKTEAYLAELEQDYKKVPDCETAEGYAKAKEGVTTLRTCRTAIEKERKRIKQPYLDAGKIIDSEAKRITERLVALEEPLKEAKKEIDEREKRQKEERLAKLDNKIVNIRAYVNMAYGHGSEAIAGMIQDVDQIDTENDFYERTMEATKARAETLEALNKIYLDTLNREQAELQKREADERAAAAEAELAALRAQVAKATPELETVNITNPVIEPFGSDKEWEQEKTAAKLDAIIPSADVVFDPALEDGKTAHHRYEPETGKYVSEIGRKLDLWGRTYRVDGEAMAELKRVLSDYVII